MESKSPVIGGWQQHEVVLAKNQPEYAPLPVLMSNGKDQTMLTRWDFTPEERELVAKGGFLYFAQMTWGRKFSPVRFKVMLPPLSPEDMADIFPCESLRELAMEIANAKELQAILEAQFQTEVEPGSEWDGNLLLFAHWVERTLKQHESKNLIDIAKEFTPKMMAEETVVWLLELKNAPCQECGNTPADGHKKDCSKGNPAPQAGEHVVDEHEVAKMEAEGGPPNGKADGAS